MLEHVVVALLLASHEYICATVERSASKSEVFYK
jgi:hypothetical protein